MSKKITKISVETTDESGKVDTTHLQESNMKSIHWKKMLEACGYCLQI